MFGIGPQELLVIMVVGLLVLGPKRLPELARSLGRGLTEFRRASSDLRQSLADDDQPGRHAPPPRPPAQAALGGSDDPADGNSIGPQPDTTAPEASEPVASSAVPGPKATPKAQSADADDAADDANK